MAKVRGHLCFYKYCVPDTFAAIYSLNHAHVSKLCTLDSHEAMQGLAL